MKYLHQALIITAVTLAAQIVKYFVPLPIPASIYGLVLLFGLLKSGALKLSQVEDVGSLLLELMPVFLIAPSVSVLTTLDAMQGMLLPVLIISFAGTIAVMAVTGWAAQIAIRREKRGGKHG